MSKKSQDKRNARAKEKAKAARKERNASPISILTSEPPECWISGTTGRDGMANIAAFRKTRTGASIAAFFLIDFACIGIKDAFYVPDAEHDAILQHYRQEARKSGMPFARIPVEEARQLVASATHWTSDHHFRLPSHLPRCLTILGGDPQSESVDTSKFGDEEGRLNYEGYRHDLETRLIDTTVEEFIARPDVTYYFADEDYPRDDADGSPLDDIPDDWEQRVLDTIEKMKSQVHAWVSAQGMQPHPQLDLAIEAICLTLNAKALPKIPVDGQSAEEEPELPDLLANVPTEAMEQVKGFLDTIIAPEIRESMED